MRTQPRQPLVQATGISLYDGTRNTANSIEFRVLLGKWAFIAKLPRFYLMPPICTSRGERRKISSECANDHF